MFINEQLYATLTLLGATGMLQPSEIINWKFCGGFKPLVISLLTSTARTFFTCLATSKESEQSPARSPGTYRRDARIS